MSLYDKLGFKPSRSKQIFALVCAAAVLVIAVWLIIRNGIGVTWWFIPLVLALIGLFVWQAAGYKNRS